MVINVVPYIVLTTFSSLVAIEIKGLYVDESVSRPRAKYED